MPARTSRPSTRSCPPGLPIAVSRRDAAGDELIAQAAARPVGPDDRAVALLRASRRYDLLARALACALGVSLEAV